MATVRTLPLRPSIKVWSLDPSLQTAFMPPIKNQGNCGSCWAFATNALIESGIKKKNGTSYNFAEQELVDCCKKPYTVCSVGGGCSGGNTEQALTYVSKWGIAFTSVYPSLAVQGTCKNSTTALNKVVSATAPVTDITRGSISALQASLQSKPTAVYVDASSWPGYSSGIFNYCTYTSLNHAVVAVGFDASGNWKVRNSWGTGWGNPATFAFRALEIRAESSTTRSLQQ